jgi:hypothetical protein
MPAGADMIRDREEGKKTYEPNARHHRGRWTPGAAAALMPERASRLIYSGDLPSLDRRSTWFLTAVT